MTRLVASLVVAGSLLVAPASARQGPAPIRVLPSVTCPSCDIQIDTSTTFQTFGGWCFNEGFLRDQNAWPQAWMDTVTDIATGTLGQTCSRVGFGRYREWVNDDADPATLGTFVAEGSMDRAADIFLTRFCGNIVAAGEPCVLMFDIETDTLPSYLSGPDGDEFGEHFSRTLKYYDDLGLPITFTTVQNEPTLNSAWATATALHGIIPTMRARFVADSVDTVFSVHETVSAQVLLETFLEDVSFDQDVIDASGLCSWHRYSDPSAYLADIVSICEAAGLQTAMLEYTAGTIDDIYVDLTDGHVSYWMPWTLTDRDNDCDGGTSSPMVACKDRTSIVKSPHFWQFRQYMRYIRPGAVRVSASTNNADVKVTAWTKSGRQIVTLRSTNGAAGDFDVGPLASGTYGVSCAPSAGSDYDEKGTTTGTTVTVSLASGDLCTVYPITGNAAPVIKTQTASPTYITSPTTTADISTTAEDPENDSLTYAWAFTSGPTTPSITSASSASTGLTGLSSNGPYVFTVTVSDGTNNTIATVTLTRYSADQPCTINPGSRFYAEEGIVLPTTTIVLGSGFIANYDLEGASTTGTFSVVSQPGGASASFTGTSGSGFTVAGDYVLRYTCQSATGTTTAQTQDFTIKVYPEPSPLRGVLYAVAFPR